MRLILGRQGFKKKKERKENDVAYNVRYPRHGVVKYRHCVPDSFGIHYTVFLRAMKEVKPILTVDSIFFCKTLVRDLMANC